MSIPTMSPRGWYADPSGRHESRYWDGMAWSEQVSDRGVHTTDDVSVPTAEPTVVQSVGPEVVSPGPTTPAPASPPPPTTSRTPAGRRRRWLIPGIAVTVILLAMAGWLLWARWVPTSPTTLRPGTPSATAVQIAWTASSGGPQADRYIIRRDDVEVGSAAATAMSYTDTGLVPDTTYRYAVIATSGSKRSDPSSELVVHTLPATPQGLMAEDRSATDLTLTWSAPETGPAPQSYVVLRDDVEVGTVSGTSTSFEDTKLAPVTTYRYRVVAVSGTNRSEPSDELSAQTLPATPAGLKAGTATTKSITVAWAAPTGPGPESYIIQRDGNQVATVEGNVTSYLDQGLAPATAYEYTVVAVSGGSRSEPSVVLRARTYAPSVAEARVQGSWDVDGKITKATSGITLGTAAAQGKTFSATWTITPKCASGACDVVLTGYLAGHRLSMTLGRSGASYTGTTKTHISHCTGLVSTKDVTNAVTVRIAVTKAGVGSGAWLANSWTGSLTMTSPYTTAGTTGSIQYYCPAGSLTASLTGVR